MTPYEHPAMTSSKIRKHIANYVSLLCGVFFRRSEDVFVNKAL